MKKYLVIAGVVALVAVSGVVALGAVALAQGPPEGPWLGFPGGKSGHCPLFSPDQAKAHWGRMQEAVADALGMSVDELEAARDDGKTLWEIAEAQDVDPADVRDAMKAAGQEMLDQAVADDLLTQEQADNIRQRVEEGPGPWRTPGNQFRLPPFLSSEQAEAYQAQMQEAMAEALGLSVDELEATRDDGKTLWEIAEEQGVDPADLWAAMETARQDLIQQAVDDGLLTQEQADWMSERMAGHGPGGWAGFGPRRGMRGMKGFPDFRCPPGWCTE